MRIDHHAFQRATRVAGMGFLVQLGLGLTLLIFGLIGGERGPQDTSFLFGGVYVLLGLLAWLGLIVIFNQHKLERLEALEEDELAAGRGMAAGERGESVFGHHEEETRPAARRLRLMYKWLLPILSLILAAALGGAATLMLRFMSGVRATTVEFQLTKHLGWAVAICLAFAALSFIVSRFVAGMAKQPVWQNLRGGAAYMVGNALVTLAIAVGIGFRFFGNNDVIRGIATSLAIFMIVMAAEIVLNFILNLYRPRVPGETPRPAYDSRLLSLFATPDSLVRSISEAVDYQFGFDITSSWGYQLLIRSVTRLVVVGAVVLMILNMMVIVEPNEQAVRLSRGAIVGDEVHGSGILWKLPWPLQTAERYDVTRVRELHLTSKQVKDFSVQLWSDDLGNKFDKPLTPFVVGASLLERDGGAAGIPAADRETEPSDEGERVSRQVSLVDAEIVLQWRIRPSDGLLDYLRFSSERAGHRERRPVREEALRVIALRGISQEFARLRLDEVLGDRRSELPARLRESVQRDFDANRTGVEVVAVDVPLLRPAGAAASGFEELTVSHQARQQYIAAAEQRVVAGLVELVGDPDAADEIIGAIEVWERLRDELGADSEAVRAQRVLVESLLMNSGGIAAETIADAEARRWITLMDTRAEASRVRGQIVSYRTAPELFRVRETMSVYSRSLAPLYKYVLCVDPARVDFDLDLTELGSMLNFADALESEDGETGP